MTCAEAISALEHAQPRPASSVAPSILRFVADDSPPDFDGVDLRDALRTYHQELSRDERECLVRVVMLSRAYGYAFIRVSKLAPQLECCERTARARLDALVAAGWFEKRRTGRANELRPDWQRFRILTAKVTDQIGNIYRSRPLTKNRRRPSRDQTADPESAVGTMIVRGVNADPGHKTSSEDPTPSPSPVVVAYVPPPHLAAACIRRHGAEAFAKVEAEAQRPGRDPEHVRQALVVLATTPANAIRKTPIAAFRFWASRAAEGDLSVPKDDSAGGTAYTRLAAAANDAHCAGDTETAGRLAQAGFELGRRDEAIAAAREQVVAIVPAPVAAQLSPPVRAVLADPTPKLPPPREAPPPLDLLLSRTRRPALPPPAPTIAEQLARAAFSPSMRLRLEAALGATKAGRS